MTASKKIRHVYDKRAGKYDFFFNKFNYESSLKNLLRYVLAGINKKGNVLDIGCGTGTSTEVLVKKFPESNIFGLDLSVEMLKVCYKKCPNVKLVMGDFNTPNNFFLFTDKNPYYFKKESFNLIISSGSISEYGDWESVMPFVYSLLKKGGIFINVGTNKNIIGIISGKIWAFKPRSRKEFISSCRKTGFKKILLVNIPMRLLPMNLVKYVVKAEK